VIVGARIHPCDNRKGSLNVIGRSCALVLCFWLVSLGTAAGADPACVAASRKAEGDINQHLAILVENTTVECAVVPDTLAKNAPCSLICFSPHSMTKDQRRAILVFLVGVVGEAVNGKRLSRSGSLNYMDRNLASGGFGLTMPIDTAASLQHLAFTDQIDALTLISAVESGFKKRSTAKPKHK
jgi:hypothetical protein